MSKTEKIVKYSCLVADAFILSWIESAIPYPLPGVKAGFSNIAVLIALFLLGPKGMIAVAITKVVLSTFTFIGFSGFIYSIAGTILCLISGIIMYRSQKFGVLSISVVGALLHNMGQLIVAVIVIGKKIIYYMPILVITGVFAGIITGIIAAEIIKRLAKAEKKEHE